ncbi:MAG: hypothetical protein AB7F32_07755, partial [Victivallaceae bacterium]
DKIRFSKEEFKKLQPHPYAEFLPMIATNREIDALKEGILMHGLLEPITIHEGQILDGRNRHRAICELMEYEKDFKYEEYVKFISVPEGISPEQYVISRNLHRRNLNESQRALFAGQMLMAFNEDRTLSKAERTILPKGSKTGHFGKIFNVSGSSVKSAQIVIKQGLPIVKDFVKKGVWRVSLARKIAELNQKDQESLVEAALAQANTQAGLWYGNHCHDLKERGVELSRKLEQNKTERDVQENALRSGLTQELAKVNLLPEEDQAGKRKNLSDIGATIEDGTHPSLKAYTAKIKATSNSLERCRRDLKKMQDDEAKQKELHAQPKLARCMIGSYKQYARSQKKAAVVVAMNFSGRTPEVEFKVVPAGQASKFLGTIKEFSNPGEGETFITANKAELDALKIEILNGTLANAPVKIQTFGGGLPDSKIA